MATVQEIYNEIDRIDNAKSGIAGAIEEKGVEVPAGAKIEEYPGLVRQIQQGDTSDCVKFTPQTLTEEQKAQARENIGAGSGGGDGKIGVISQTQTWSGSGSNRTYVMRNPVTGLIPQANIDLFESAGAVFNETTGYFELNGLTDISYEEMSAIYNFGQLPYALSNYLYQVRYIRTNLPTARITADSLSTFARDSSFEVVAFNPNADFRPAGTSGAYAFYSMQNVKRIIGVLNLSAITSGARFVEYSLLLGDFRFKSLKFSISLMSPFVTKDSLLYLINNEASTSAITITLEASVYAKCQSGGEWYSDISTALAAHTKISLASA